ncbi:hypothetical protein [Photobacterium rosenbergii]|uniref:Uncharacterized protein n=1 Tax=Photobacterium rosenbergii TaxID=294936 RepID=A0ABU3ZQH4_9GAMM|nr:hypothetical protein [Photobacterium rosenbergii]MDV5172335.1 hypothetical protein [Photobacterium rosenbergii]
MRRQQNGFVTLGVTLMLMLLGSYGLYRSAEMSQYNVKRFQNALLAQKSHWSAEGGLQCAFGINQTTLGTPETRSYGACNSVVLAGSLDEERLSLMVSGHEVSGGLYTLKSVASEDNGPGKREVAKDVKVETVAAMPGIFKTSSNITLRGDFELLPNFNDGECITMVVKNHSNFFHTDTTTNSKVIVQDGNGYNSEQLPEGVIVDDINKTADLDNSTICNLGYQSFAKVGIRWPLAKDIVEEPNMDMFKDLFGVPKTQWDTVKNNGTFEMISPPDGEVLVTDCAEQINNAFEQGARSFWVEGSCYLQHPSNGTGSKPFNFSAPAEAMPDTDSVVIVVQDGAVFYNGSVGISGLLYQFDTGNKSTEDISSEMLMACSKAGQCIDSSQEKIYQNSAFYINGSLYAFGGIAVDIEGMNFIVNASFIAKYNDNYWKDRLPNPTNTKVTWQQGTWRDFQ